MKKSNVQESVKQLMFLVLVISNVAFAQPSIDFNPLKQQFTSDMLVLYPFGPKGAPYLVNIEIEKDMAGDFYLVSTIDFVDSAYVASPFSSKNFTGKFKADFKENKHASLHETLTATPKPMPKFSKYGTNEVDDWIREKTTFRQRIVLSKDVDFEIEGRLSFTIEPRCSFELVPFIIAYKNGRMTVKPGGC